MNFDKFMDIAINKWLWFLSILCLLFLVSAKYWSDLQKDKKIKIKVDLINHTFFNKMDIYYRMVKNIKVKNEAKRDLIIDFLQIKIDVFKDWLKELVLKTNFDNLTDSELCHLFLTLITDLIQEYESLAIKMWIPKYFLNKFNNWHQDTIDITIENIQEISQNDIYWTQEQKAYFILNMMKNAFYLTVKDAETTIGNINWWLSKYTYKNKLIWDYEQK